MPQTIYYFKQPCVMRQYYLMYLWPRGVTRKRKCFSTCIYCTIWDLIKFSNLSNSAIVRAMYFQVFNYKRRPKNIQVLSRPNRYSMLAVYRLHWCGILQRFTILTILKIAKTVSIFADGFSSISIMSIAHGPLYESVLCIG